jgi:putative transposon-encoded protein
MQRYSSLSNWRGTFSGAGRYTKDHVINFTSLKRTAGYALLAALMIPLMVFGQSVPRPISSNSSLFAAKKRAAAERSGTKGKPQKIHPVRTGNASPKISAAEGDDPCGWTADTNSPTPMLDHGTTTIGANLYTFAGVGNGDLLADANKFNGSTWSSITPIPNALEYPTVVSDGTSAYIIDGSDADGITVNTMYRYNPATNDYTTLAPSAAGSESWNAAGAYLNGKIYKIGGYHSDDGFDTNSLATVEIYDIANNTWSTGAPYPIVQGWMSAFVKDNFIYLAGGVGAEDDALPSLKTYRYDPATNTWDDASIADLPTERWGAASSQTVYNGGWVLAGGFINQTFDLTGTVTEWNPATNTWSSRPNMPEARGRMTGSVLNGAFHVIGGRPEAGGFNGTDDNQRLFCPPIDAPFITGGVTYVSDNGIPQNGTPDPGETAAVNLDLHNVGGVNSGNVVATLQGTGGITSPSGPVNYGVINTGATVSHSFTFQVPANTSCGSQITLTFSVVDGSSNYTVTKTYSLGVLQVSFSQNFDGVTAPALPSGWTTSSSGLGIPWVTTAAESDTTPNSAFTNDPDDVGEANLESPVIPITSANAQVSFRLHYDLEESFDGETGFDGAVLEIKIGSGAYQDILAAGGTFVSNGYNRTISANFQNPLSGREAWSGDSAAYLPVTVNLPAAANGQSIQLKWRMGSDESFGVTGVNVDSVIVSGGYLCSAVNVTPHARADFDGDGKTDLSVFRPSEGNWYLNRSTDGFAVTTFGSSTDTPVPADYDGDGKTDIAIFRPDADDSHPDYWVLQSSNLVLVGYSWGLAGDIPLIGDYDGDGKADPALYRGGGWYIRLSGGGSIITVYGPAGVPIAGDFNGDGKTELGVYHSGIWTYAPTGNGFSINVAWGTAGDILVPADYDGDGKTDLSVFRPSNGNWYILRSSGGSTVTSFGTAGDVPVPGDYDGDGKDDLAIYRDGIWWVNRSTGGIVVTGFGTGSDKPLPRTYIP